MRIAFLLFFVGAAFTSNVFAWPPTPVSNSIQNLPKFPATEADNPKKLEAFRTSLEEFRKETVEAFRNDLEKFRSQVEDQRGANEKLHLSGEVSKEQYAKMVKQYREQIHCYDLCMEKYQGAQKKYEQLIVSYKKAKEKISEA